MEAELPDSSLLDRAAEVEAPDSVEAELPASSLLDRAAEVEAPDSALLFGGVSPSSLDII